MTTSGDIAKANAEMRPAIIEYLKEFDVECSQEERIRAAKIADQVSDYDPAGMFAHYMYSAMLAAGDESLEDMSAYAYYIATMGELADDVSGSYVSFLETVTGVAGLDMEDKEHTRMELLDSNVTFEERTIRQIRSTYMTSDLFRDAIDDVTGDLQDNMLKGVSVKPKRFTVLIKEMHTELDSVCFEYMVDDDYKEIVGMIDNEYPLSDSDIAEEIIKDFAGKLAPLMALLDFDGDGGKIKKHFGDNAKGIGESMVFIRRSTMLLGSLYMTIGSGKLGLDGNKRVAYAIKDALKRATERADRMSTNVLKLEKQTTAEGFISQN